MTSRRARPECGRSSGARFVKAWRGNVFSEAAEAAYWQTLSLPPLLLGLLGCVGFLGDWLGPSLVNAVEQRIIGFCRTVFSPNVVDTILQPTVADILTRAQAEVASVGFLISLRAGSSAMASFVDAITVAYGQRGLRNDVWQRVVALLLYLVALVLAVIGPPVLALGPDLLPKVFPESWRGNITNLIGTFHYPVVGLLLVVALATLYKVALPRKLPWWRGVPGAVLAMIVFLSRRAWHPPVPAEHRPHGLHVRRAGRADRVPAVHVLHRSGHRGRRALQQRHPGDVAGRLRAAALAQAATPATVTRHESRTAAH